MKLKIILSIISFVLILLITGCSKTTSTTPNLSVEKECCELCSILPSDKPSCWVIISQNNGSQKCINYFKENPRMIPDCENVLQ